MICCRPQCHFMLLIQTDLLQQHGKQTRHKVTSYFIKCLNNRIKLFLFCILLFIILVKWISLCSIFFANIQNRKYRFTIVNIITIFKDIYVLRSRNTSDVLHLFPLAQMWNMLSLIVIAFVLIFSPISFEPQYRYHSEGISSVMFLQDW